jgi:signal transduction histidine kinase/ActR/RegA family two-component response regulator
VLASSLDYRTTLATVARLAVPFLADWNVVDLVEDRGAAITRVAVVHADPSLTELAHQMQRYAPDPARRRGVWQVSQSGRSQLLSEFTDAHAQATARDAEHLAMIRALEIRSYLCVPMVARGRVLGTLMCLTTSRSGRSYSEADVVVAEELACRAALAVDNARLFDEAQRSSAAKDVFLATVSHELRTPLAATLSWVQLLRSGRLDEGQRRRAYEVIERSARAQAKMVDDMLDVSRIAAGKLELELEELELGAAIRDALAAIAPEAAAKQIELAQRLEPGEHWLKADAVRLRQILDNLLSNAMKFTLEGGRVEIALQSVEKGMRVRVEDTGIGMSRELLPHVFDRFRQGPSAMWGSRNGLGLGLAIVRELVRLHGGSIRVESEGEGAGTVFHIDLPVIERRNATIAPPARPSLPVPRLDGVRVLVVDDDEVLREAISLVLVADGASVIQASSGQEALRLLQKTRPDVLLSDLSMPDGDGFALIRAVRALPANEGGDTPAGALTAHAARQDRERAMAAGFECHLSKPICNVTLIEQVAHLAKQNAARPSTTIAPQRLGWVVPPTHDRRVGDQHD